MGGRIVGSTSTMTKVGCPVYQAGHDYYGGELVVGALCGSINLSWSPSWMPCEDSATMVLPQPGSLKGKCAHRQFL
jgi:hypothetical protein